MGQETTPFDHASIDDYMDGLKKIVTDDGYHFVAPGGACCTVIYVEDFDTLDGYTVERDTDDKPVRKDTGMNYETLVNDLIRNRYTLSEELSILRQQSSKAEEYEAYYNYCEECKAEAKRILAAEALAYDNGDSGQQ